MTKQRDEILLKSGRPPLISFTLAHLSPNSSSHCQSLQVALYPSLSLDYHTLYTCITTLVTVNMKYSAAVLALASGALAHSSGWGTWPTNGTVAVETIVTTAYTTYCPYATEVVQNGKTYTVTEATILTITDCPCTFTRVRLSLPSSRLTQN